MYLENNQVHRYPVKIFFSWLFVIFWMGIIFALSHQSPESSNQISEGIAKAILRLSNGQPTPAAISQLEPVIRDVGHGLLYLVLAIFVAVAFSTLLIQEFGNAGLTLLVCSLYAIADELHQALVPGRSSQMRDFVIDVIGIAAGILIYQIVSAFRYSRSDLKINREDTVNF